MPVSGSGFLPLADASPGLQSPCNRLKSAAQRDWLSTFFKSRLLHLGSMQLAFCAYCITRERERGGGAVYLLIENRSSLLVSQQFYEFKLLGFVNEHQHTVCSTTHATAFKDTRSRPASCEQPPTRFTHTRTHTLPGFKQTYDLIVFGKKYHPLLETGSNKKSIICAVAEVMMKRSV